MPKLKHRTVMPRPNDQSIIDAYAKAVEHGHPQHTAATLAGISHGTAKDWLQLGNAEIEEGDVQGSHVAFASAVNAAQAAFVERNLGVVNDAATTGPKGWVAAMTLMERRMPRDFGRNDRLEVEQRTVNVNISMAELGVGQRAALMALLAVDNSTPDAPQLPAPQTQSES